MPLPATGQEISMQQVDSFFGLGFTPIEMSDLGNSLLGISVGGTINLSATFGGLDLDIL